MVKKSQNLVNVVCERPQVDGIACNKDQVNESNAKQRFYLMMQKLFAHKFTKAL